MKAPQKKTADCFKGFEYRDSNLDTLLPKVQEAQECEVSVLTLTEEMTFGEMAQHFFGSSSIEEIKKHTLTLPIFSSWKTKTEASRSATCSAVTLFVLGASASTSSPTSVAGTLAFVS
jgi:hypothetical protein